MEERIKSKDLLGKVLISEETGKKFGVISDIDFIIESGLTILDEETFNGESVLAIAGKKGDSK